MEPILRRRKGLSGGRVVVASLAAVALLGVPAGGASAQEGGSARDDVRSPIARGAQAVGYKHHEGEYGGVTPGVIYPYADQDQEKRVKRPPPKYKNALYWIGFQPRDGGSSRVFVQLGREVEYEQRVEGNVLLVTVVGVKNRSRNTLRRIDTHYFDSAIKEVRAKRVHKRRAHKGRPAQKAGVVLAITFKNPVDASRAQASLTKEEDGYYYLFLDFGPGTPLPEKPDAAEDASSGDTATPSSE